MNIAGVKVDHLRVYVPSTTIAGEPFYVTIKPEDNFNNISSETIANITILNGSDELSHILETIAQSTAVRAQIRLPHDGVSRIRVVDNDRGIEGSSNPTICSTLPPLYKTYWGMIHGHSEMSDGHGSIDNYFRQIRDETALDFATSSDHDRPEETTDEMWDIISQKVADLYEPGKFITFLGYEWARGDNDGDGHRNVYYLNDFRPLFRSADGYHSTPPELFTALAQERAMVIPHQTAAGESYCDWKDHDPQLQRLVEIYQGRGSFECDCSTSENVPVSLNSGFVAVNEGFVRNALLLGLRLGFTAGGDDHNGSAGSDYVGGTTKSRAGLMSVFAGSLTRESIWDALWNRRVVATTGPRILLFYELNNFPLGSEIITSNSDLFNSRTIRIRFHGTESLERLDIIRNNEVVRSFTAGDMNCNLDCETSWIDDMPLDSALLKPTTVEQNPFAFYYVRAVQTDGQVAWASPIWIIRN